MAGETEIPKGLPPFVPLVKVPANTGFATHFLPMSGIASSGGEVSFLQTLFQPSRTDELDTTTTVTGQTLHIGTSRSGSLPSFGLQAANTPYAPDPEDSNNFLRNTAGEVFGAGTGADAVLTNRQGQDVRAFLYGFNATGSDARPVRVNDANELVVTGVSVPSTVTTFADVAIDEVAATQLIAANADRQQVILQNTQAAGGITIRVGDANVTASRGIRLAPGESVTLSVTAALSGIAETAGSVDVAVTELET